MESMIVVIVFGVVVVGLWRMGRARKRRLENPVPDPASPNEATWDWDVDFSGGGDFW